MSDFTYLISTSGIAGVLKFLIIPKTELEGNKTYCQGPVVEERRAARLHDISYRIVVVGRRHNKAMLARSRCLRLFNNVAADSFMTRHITTEGLARRLGLSAHKATPSSLQRCADCRITASCKWCTYGGSHLRPNAWRCHLRWNDPTTIACSFTTICL